MRRKTVGSIELPDLSKPVDTEKVSKPEVECFGKMWDISTRECSLCAANELCAIITQEIVAKKVKEMDKEEKFLDLQDFSFDKNLILDWIKNSSEPITSNDLVEKVFELAKSKDSVAIIEYIKRLVKDTEGLSIKDKIVYYG